MKSLSDSSPSTFYMGLGGVQNARPNREKWLSEEDFFQVALCLLRSVLFSQTSKIVTKYRLMVWEQVQLMIY